MTKEKEKIELINNELFIKIAEEITNLLTKYKLNLVEKKLMMGELNSFYDLEYSGKYKEAKVEHSIGHLIKSIKDKQLKKDL